MRFASSWNQAVSALSALTGARQSSGCTGDATGRAPPSCEIVSRERIASSAGVPKRPKRNQDMPRTPSHPKDASARTAAIPSCTSPPDC
jgi:hypothetical protein